MCGVYNNIKSCFLRRTKGVGEKQEAEGRNKNKNKNKSLLGVFVCFKKDRTCMIGPKEEEEKE